MGENYGKFTRKMRTKIIIDADPGTDDAQALIMLLEAHYNFEIEIIAIMTVAGNSSLENINKNLLRILEVSNSLSNIPVFYGAGDQLVQNFVRDTSPFHGIDGFGEVDFETPLPILADPKSKYAPLELVDIVNKLPGEVILLAIGPLTNIAIAMSIDSQFTSKLKDLYIMGGNLTGIGNIVSAAEFNFYADPEAAKIVLDRTQIPIKLVPLETCFECASFPYDERKRIGNTGTEIAKFLNNSDDMVIKDAFHPTWVACDQVASAWLLDNLKPKLDQTLEVQTEEILGTVETAGSHTRGMMVRLKFVNRPNNIIAMKVMNTGAFTKYLKDAFSAVF